MPASWAASSPSYAYVSGNSSRINGCHIVRISGSGTTFSQVVYGNEEDKKSVTLEEVRAVLAEKSREGKTAEVKGLLTKFGVNKLSELDASKYDELLKETEGI